MGTQQHISKSTQAVSTASSAKLLQTRPFQNEHESENQQPSQLQTAESTASSFDLTTKTFSTTEPATASPAVPTLGLPLQAKLTIGEPNDKYEQEADRVAQDVVQRINAPDTPSSPENTNNLSTNSSLRHQPSQHQAQRQVAPKTAVSGLDLTTKTFAIAPQPIAAPKPLLQPKLVPSESALQREVQEEDELQMKPLQRQTVAGGEASNELESTINRARSGGQSLDTKLQQSMGQAMGADFSGVKVHTDSTADTLNKSIQAKAFTTGQDLFFRQGTYQPTSRAGQELIAHELTHVVQQNGSTVQRRSDNVVQRVIYQSWEDKSKIVSAEEAAKFLIGKGIDAKLAAKLAGDYSLKGEVALQGLYQLALKQNPVPAPPPAMPLNQPQNNIPQQDAIGQEELQNNNVVNGNLQEVVNANEAPLPQQQAPLPPPLPQALNQEAPLPQQQAPLPQQQAPLPLKVPPAPPLPQALNQGAPLPQQAPLQNIPPAPILGNSDAQGLPAPAKPVPAKKKNKEPQEAQQVSAPSFGKDFASTSIGSEVELQHVSCALTPNAARTIGYVEKAGTKEALVMITKDQKIGFYMNPAKRDYIPTPKPNEAVDPKSNIWLVHCIELVLYPTEKDNAEGLADRNNAVQSLISFLNTRVVSNNHEPLQNGSFGDNNCFNIVITNKNHIVAAGLANSEKHSDEAYNQASFGKDSVQATLGYSAEGIAAGDAKDLAILYSAPWYKAQYGDEVNALSANDEVEEKVKVKNVYTVLKSIIAELARICIKYNYPLENFNPPEPCTAGADGLANSNIKNEWKIMPRTTPSLLLKILKAEDQKKARKYINQSAVPQDISAAWVGARELVMGGGQLTGHNVDNAKVGNQQAILFEYRTDLPSELTKDLPQPTEKETEAVADPMAIFSATERSKVIQAVNEFINTHKVDFAEWFNKIRETKGQSPFNPNKAVKSAPTSTKVNWIQSEHPEEWTRISLAAKSANKPPVALSNSEPNQLPSSN